MIITITQFIVVVLACCLSGALIGAVATYFIIKQKYGQEFRCNHEFKQISSKIMTATMLPYHKTSVHMCKKCGKRKVTKV